MAWGKSERLIMNHGCSSVNEPPLTCVIGWLNLWCMKGIAWGVLWVLGSATLWAQPVEVNRVKAVVGGTRVITMHDLVEFRNADKAPLRGRKPNTVDTILDEIVDEALLVHEVRTRKGFVMPAGLGERLLASHIRRENKKRTRGYSRGDLVREKQNDGITLEQFKEQLIDVVFLRAALEPIRDSVQVSPRAVSQFIVSEDGLKKLGRGPYADFLAIQIPASEEGINKTKVKALVGGIKSVNDFKKLAEKRKVAGGGLKGRVYIDLENTHYVDAEVTATLSGIEAGKAGLHHFEGDEIFHVMFVTERGDQEKHDLNDPVLRRMIKGELSGRQYNARLQLKIQRLKLEINVYRPGINNN